MGTTNDNGTFNALDDIFHHIQHKNQYLEPLFVFLNETSMRI